MRWVWRELHEKPFVIYLFIIYSTIIIFIYVEKHTGLLSIYIRLVACHGVLGLTDRKD